MRGENGGKSSKLVSRKRRFVVTNTGSLTKRAPSGTRIISRTLSLKIQAFDEVVIATTEMKDTDNAGAGVPHVTRKTIRMRRGTPVLVKVPAKSVMRYVESGNTAGPIGFIPDIIWEDTAVQLTLMGAKIDGYHVVTFRGYGRTVS